MAKGPDGVKQVFPSSRGNPQSWYFQGVQDARMKIGGDGGTWSKNLDGSFSLSQNNKAFISIETNDIGGTIGVNQLVNSARGFMRNNRDWNSVEATLYAFVESDNTNVDYPIIIGVHGANPERNVNNRCLGVGYQCSLYKAGIIKFSKALWYPNGYFYDVGQSATADIAGRWIGLKFIVTTLGPRKVILRAYIDEGNLVNNWLPKNILVDSGGWGGQGADQDTLSTMKNVCGGSSDQVLDNGGPSVWFKWDNFSQGIRMKNLSVREIVPMASVNDSPVGEASARGSRKPVFGIVPPLRDPLQPFSENFATEDREGL